MKIYGFQAKYNFSVDNDRNTKIVFHKIVVVEYFLTKKVLNEKWIFASKHLFSEVEIKMQKLAYLKRGLSREGYS